MDIALAKEFILLNDYSDVKDNKLYVSKDIHKLMEMNDNTLIGIYGVIDTEDGEKLLETDFSYSGEPILMRTLFHKKYFMNHYWNREVINLD